MNWKLSLKSLKFLLHLCDFTLGLIIELFVVANFFEKLRFLRSNVVELHS